MGRRRCNALARLARIVISGSALESSLNTLAWPQVTVMLLTILTTVIISEWITDRVRRAII